jgi:hypothetical protein
MGPPTSLPLAEAFDKILKAAPSNFLALHSPAKQSPRSCHFPCYRPSVKPHGSPSILEAVRHQETRLIAHRASLTYRGRGRRGRKSLAQNRPWACCLACLQHVRRDEPCPIAEVLVCGLNSRSHNFRPASRERASRLAFWRCTPRVIVLLTWISPARRSQLCSPRFSPRFSYSQPCILSRCISSRKNPLFL